MKNKNVYKPRYKIPHLAKKKNWIYKNCRMRRFFNIRGRKLKRRGYFKRIVLVFNNMKWAIARRYVGPYRHQRRAGGNRKRYRLRFQTKQLVRNFYGKVKETTFRQILRNFIMSTKRRNNSFFAALERRLDMVVFRLKYLPTIFSCNQLVQHYGICVNRKIEKTPHSLVRVGDIITLTKSHWDSIFVHINRLILYRALGTYIARRRQLKLIKKKTWILKKKKRFKRVNFSLIRKKFKIFSYIRLIKRQLKIYDSVMLGEILKNVSSISKGQALQNFKEDFDNEDKNFSGIIEWNYLLSNQKFSKTTYDSTKRIKLLMKNLKKVLKKSKKVLWKNLKKIKRKRNYFIKKWKWKKNYSFLLKIMAFNFNFTKMLNYLWLRLRLEEIARYRKLLVNMYLKYNKENNAINKFYDIQDDKTYQQFLKIIWEYEKIVKKKYAYLSKILITHYKFILKNKLKQKKKKKKKAMKRMIKFYAKRRRKKQRKLSILRLRSYHWYIPSYLEFDYNTMSGMLIRSPLNKEIYLPFRCTLRKIYSFYRSRGF